MLSIDGLASGLDTSGLIAQILQAEARPLQLFNAQITKEQNKKTAFLDLSAKLLGLQLSSNRLSQSDTFRRVTASSTNSDVISASAGAGVPPGTYSFRVAQLASGSQFASHGFATADDTVVGAGTLSLELGGGFVNDTTELDSLNGDTGVSRGSIRITDRSGANAVVDLSAAITLDDVIEAINGASGINVTASIADTGAANPGRGLVITDGTGSTTSNLIVEEVSGNTTASDLGLLDSVAASTLEGDAIQRVTRDTRISSLNDGLGLRLGAGDDVLITRTDGTQVDIDVDSLATVGDIIDAIANNANNADGFLTLGVNADGDGFDLVDVSGGGGGLTVLDNSSGLGSAASDLGIAGAIGGGTINGTRVLAGLNDTLLSTLNGGTGVKSGSITIQDRASGSGVTIDLTTAETLQDVLRAVNASAADVTARLNSAGNGLLIADNSGGSGDLIIAEAGSTTAAELGILQTVSDDEVSGTDLDAQYINENTLLSSLNGGRGVGSGSIQITDADGKTFTVNLGNDETLEDVLVDISGAAGVAGSALVAQINDAGNGILLSSPVGAGTLSVAEVGTGTTARDLNLLGSADALSPSVIDGSFQFDIAISATDTLDDVREAIQDLGIDVTASVVNDGSSNSPFRLSIVSAQTGNSARLMVESSASALTFNQTARARDAMMFFGETGGGSQPILLRNNTNTFSDVVDGLTVSAQEQSNSTVRVSVARDNERLIDDVAGLIEEFNAILADIDALTDFDLETEQRGLLIGDGTLRNIENTIIRGLNAPLEDVGNSIVVAKQIGIELFSGKLTFDRSEFEDALVSNPSSIEQFFSAVRSLTASVDLDDLNEGDGVDLDTAGADFQLQLRDGSTVDVDIAGSSTVQDVIDAINTAGGGNVTATLSSASNSLVLTDATTGATTFKVIAQNGSRAFNDLGINRSADLTGGGEITGSSVSLSDNPGMASRLFDAIEGLVNTETGSIQSRADGLDKIITSLQEQITQTEERLVRRESLLRRQFAQLEQVIQSSQATMDRLSASLSSIGG